MCEMPPRAGIFVVVFLMEGVRGFSGFGAGDGLGARLAFSFFACRCLCNKTRRRPAMESPICSLRPGLALGHFHLT
jgi:hypothetical protein